MTSGRNREGERQAFFSLVLFRQVGLHLRGASWLALSYPQVNARLCVRDADNAAAVFLLRQLVPGWVVPIGRLVGGQPLSAAVCDFPHGLPRELPLRRNGATSDPAPDLSWNFSAGARLAVSVRLDGGGVAGTGKAGSESRMSPSSVIVRAPSGVTAQVCGESRPSFHRPPSCRFGRRSYRPTGSRPS